MASSADPDRIRAPSSRVRIIGRIRDFADQECESLSQTLSTWITVCKPPLEQGASTQHRVTLSFSDHSSTSSKKDASYVLDYCYKQDEGTDIMFLKEIKPLIAGVFRGDNASIIVYGARGSGKTYTIQGTDSKPGLAVMAMAELLSKAEELGKSVSVSICEIYQEHAYDLLDAKHSEVQVLEDARGRINLKGLSQVSVKSISEFHNLYFSRSCFVKTDKTTVEQPKRSHKVLSIYISSVDDDSNTKLVRKMNFVDLAGYEDTKRTSKDGNTIFDSTRINKSLHTVLNVVYALNANESHVPYRESKLTHMLKESLGGKNPVLMITCLNPLFCQDTIHSISIASRSCQSNTHLLANSIKKARSLGRLQLLSPQKIVKPSTTPTVGRQVASGVNLSTKEDSNMSNGRKLFGERKKLIFNQAKSPKRDGSVKMFEHHPGTPSAVTPSLLKEALEDKPLLDLPLALVPVKVVSQDKSCEDYSLASVLEEDDISTCNGSNNFEVTPTVNCDKSLPEHDGATGMENKCLLTNEGGSPPLSESLRELSNNFKLFSSKTALSIKMPKEIDKLQSDRTVFADIIEPKTPIAENYTVNGRVEITKYNSPWETFSTRSSGMKNSLVQEYLNFLNSASKEELKGIKGIGEKRATYILELREKSPEPFKSLEDLQDIGLSAKQIKGMMKKVAGELFS